MGFWSGLLLGLLASGAGGNDRAKTHRARSWEANSDFFADDHAPDFIDYRDKWGYDNDHDWDADGDMHWDL